MIQYLTTIATLIWVTGTFAQSRININNNAFIRISNNAKVVVDNPNANAIATSGTGGNIVSEGELNELIWRIGTGTGTYSIPFTTTPSVSGGNQTKIPLTMTISSAGVVANPDASFKFSTYETADNNTVWHSRVNHMNGENTGTDNSLFVVDRFWQLDGINYTTRPSATISFTYDDAANEIDGTNTITEANLKAQRWNDATSSWGGLLYGTNNATNNVVSGVDFASAGFHEVWVLTDATSPLPVEFGQLSVSSAGCKNYIHWNTFAERNNDYFLVQKSLDLEEWINVGKIEGAGNSVEEIHYEFVDVATLDNSIAYYRVKQVDFDGTADNSDIVSVKQNCGSSNEPLVFPNPFNNQITVVSDNSADIQLMDAKGKIMYETFDLPKGKNVVSLENLPSGMYILKVSDEFGIHIFRLIKN